VINGMSYVKTVAAVTPVNHLRNTTMTKSELIKHLTDMPEDFAIVIRTEDEDLTEVTDIEIKDDCFFDGNGKLTDGYKSIILY
jgi:hypothetical protein